jgi:hypothetical protein
MVNELEVAFGDHSVFHNISVGTIALTLASISEYRAPPV